MDGIKLQPDELALILCLIPEEIARDISCVVHEYDDINRTAYVREFKTDRLLVRYTDCIEITFLDDNLERDKQ